MSLTDRVAARYVLANEIDALLAEIARVRPRLRRLSVKLQDGPDDTLVTKAVALAAVVQKAGRRAHETLSAQSSGQPKVTDALAYLDKKLDEWAKFMADPEGYSKASNLSFGVERGSPAEILIRFWSEAQNVHDAIRQARNAIVYAR